MSRKKHVAAFVLGGFTNLAVYKLTGSILLGLLVCVVIGILIVAWHSNSSGGAK